MQPHMIHGNLSSGSSKLSGIHASRAETRKDVRGWDHRTWVGVWLIGERESQWGGTRKCRGQWLGELTDHLC